MREQETQMSDNPAYAKGRRGRLPGSPAPKYAGRRKGVPNKVPFEVKAACAALGPKCVDELYKLAFRSRSYALRFAAIKEILDRGFGKAATIVTGDADGGPITFRWGVRPDQAPESVMTVTLERLPDDSSPTLDGYDLQGIPHRDYQK